MVCILLQKGDGAVVVRRWRPAFAQGRPRARYSGRAAGYQGKTARDACPESPQRIERESLGLTSKLPAESSGKSLPRDSGALPIVEHGNVAPRQTRFCRAKIRRAIWDRSGSRPVAKSRDRVGMRGAAKINPPALVRAVRGVDDAFRTSAR